MDGERSFYIEDGFFVSPLVDLIITNIATTISRISRESQSFDIAHLFGSKQGSSRFHFPSFFTVGRRLRGITRNLSLPFRSNCLKWPPTCRPPLPLKYTFRVAENLYANLAVFRSTRRCSFPLFAAHTHTRKDLGDVDRPAVLHYVSPSPYIELCA